MSVSAGTGSVTDAGHQKPVGGAFSYASSMTSGDIHMMDEAEYKSHAINEKLDSWPLTDATDVDRVQVMTTGYMTTSDLDYSGLDFSDARSPVPLIKDSSELTLDSAHPIKTGPTPQHSSSGVQKHPAAFQCTLCPKKFTRAYNLRSHLRIHSDERLFICTVCGKAFARQHDRKRHEGLHSGEKKLICRGELSGKAGQTWGCGRRFARVDALGRHFRSEAGQICIKPLLEEEQAERQRQAHEIGAQSLTVGPSLSVFNLPAALIAQYPALVTIDWNAIEPEKVNFDPGELSDINATDY